MFSSNARAFLMVAPLLFLSACGEGWVAEKSDQVFPYGNKRTAGSGVVYVRAQMMPEKELKLEPVAVKEEAAPIEKAPAVKPALDAEDIFEDAQEKGSFSNKSRVEPVHAALDDGQAEALMKAEMTEMDVPADAVEPAVEEAAAAAEVTAEEYIAKSPKRIETPDVSVKDAPSEHEDVVEVDGVIEAEAVIEEIDVVTEEVQESVVEATAHEDVEVVKDVAEEAVSSEDQAWSDEILAPKKDFLGYVPEGGQSALSEIYADGF